MRVAEGFIWIMKNLRDGKKEISTLLDPLEKYWPSLSCGSPSKCYGGKGSFWGHEVKSMGLVPLQWFEMSTIIF
uniref:Uncharacterized protein n=1 Tax=Vitis vinifera TaxID=29760 RepID=F6I1Y3_VITVI